MRRAHTCLKSITTLFLLLFALTTSALADEEFELYGTVYLNSSGLAETQLTLQVGSTAIATTTTDSNGNYSFMVEPGTYNILIDPPAATGIGQSRRTGIVVSQRSRQDIILQGEGEAITFRGRLLLSDEQRTDIQLRHASLSNPNFSTGIPVDQNGVFEVALDQGHYYFQLTKPVNAEFPFGFWYQFHVEVSPEIDNIEQAIDVPLTTITGTVVDPNQQPLTDVIVSVSSAYRIGWSTEGTDGNLYSNYISLYSSSYTYEVDEQGRFVLWLPRRIPAMADTQDFLHRTTINLEPSESSGFGGKQVVFEHVDEAETSIEIELKPASLVSGVVKALDDVLIPDAEITIYRADSGEGVAAVRTNTQGEFSVGLADGAYRVQVESLWQQYSNKMPTVMNWGTDLIVDGATEFNIQVQLVRMHGQVTDGAGNSIADAVLQVPWAGEHYKYVQYAFEFTEDKIKTDENGFYEMWMPVNRNFNGENSTVADIMVSPQLPSHVAIQTFEQVDYTDNASFEQNFVLSEGAHVTGSLTGPSGQLLRNFTVQVMLPSNRRLPIQLGSDGEGQIDLRFMPGEYLLEWQGGNQQQDRERGLPGIYNGRYYLQVPESGIDEGVSLPFALIGSTFADNNGVGIPNVGIQLEHEASQYQSVYEPGAVVGSRSAYFYLRYFQHLSKTDSDGKFPIWFPLPPSDDPYIEEFNDEFYRLNMTAVPPRNSGFDEISIGNLYVESDQEFAAILQFNDVLPPTITSGPIVSNLTMTSATINWTTNEPATTQLYLGNELFEESGYRTNHEMVLMGLIPDNYYEVMVTASDAAGNGPTRAYIYFTTEAEENVTYMEFTMQPVVESVTETGAVVRWQTSEPATTRVVLSNVGEIQVDGFRTVHEVVLSGLNPETAYTAEVYSTNQQGNQTIGREREFTTRAAPDTTPPVITSQPWVVNVSETGFTVEWRTDEPATSGVSYNDGDVFGVQSQDGLRTNHSVRVTGLQAGKTYHVTVSSTDGEGNGPTLSETIQVQTLANFEAEIAPIFTRDPEVCDAGTQRLNVCLQTDKLTTVVVSYVLMTDDEEAEPVTGEVVMASPQRAHNIVIPGLQPGSQYQISVVATDNTDLSVRASDLVGATSEETPPELVWIVEPQLLFSSDNLGVIEFETSRPTQALVLFGKVGEQNLERLTRSDYQRVHQFTLGNLEPGATYFYLVQVLDADDQVLTVDAY